MCMGKQKGLRSYDRRPLDTQKQVLGKRDYGFFFSSFLSFFSVADHSLYCQRVMYRAFLAGLMENPFLEDHRPNAMILLI